MSIIAWLVLGAIAGYAAHFILHQKTGLIMTVAFGIVGAVVGGLVGSFITGGGLHLSKLMSEFNITSIIVAIIGAVGVGLVGGWFNSRRA